MGRWRGAFFGAVGLFIFPGLGQSQEPWEWNFIPQLGYYLPVTESGPIAPVSDVRYLSVKEIERTVSFGLQANLGLPIEGLAASFRGLSALPTDASGTLDCFPGLYCPALLLPSEARAWVWSGVVGLLYHPFSESGFNGPFLTAGAGLKQTRYSWPDRSSSGVTGSEHTETQGTLHFGIGFDMVLGGIPARLEISDYWTAEGDRFGLTYPEAWLSSAWPPRRASQHDLNISLGWILPLN